MADIFTQAHSHSIDRVRGGPAHKLGSRAVSGEADQDKGTGIFSFARYRDGAGATDDSLFTRRCCSVLNHECGHLLGIKHCVYARCLMNGSSSLREAESRPLALCPIDLAKYCDTLTRAALMPSTEGLAQESRDQAAFLAARESA
eukprot:CAMPEP_0119487530 /NCGR_PEP_ID=MMETSP1344-20130328/13590_1 /TAXON_ID=236787 /ORGANISM="Florenciella parvula, Strain CCMP2471" /LENGTH=144 /DNA_ID=CAMNT_0007522399 /DNA_START=80 /DNA_END=511 /DNA_ORIENTATION=+